MMRNEWEEISNIDKLIDSIDNLIQINIQSDLEIEHLELNKDELENDYNTLFDIKNIKTKGIELIVEKKKKVKRNL